MVSADIPLRLIKFIANNIGQLLLVLIKDCSTHFILTFTAAFGAISVPLEVLGLVASSFTIRIIIVLAVD